MRKVALIIVAVAASASFWVWADRQLSIDGCLDSSRAWDYAADRCIDRAAVSTHFAAKAENR
jgi:hypothetical protein